MRRSSVFPGILVLCVAGSALPVSAGRVTCDDEVLRLARALSYSMLSPEATQQAQQRLLKELEKCEPVLGPSLNGDSGQNSGRPSEHVTPRTHNHKGPKPPVPPTPPRRPRGGSTPPMEKSHPDRVAPDAVPTDLERQSLRGYQGTLSSGEMREGERRLDAIERQAATNPSQARSMMQIFQQDRALSTVNRPLGNLPSPPLGTPSLMGPAGNVGTGR